MLHIHPTASAVVGALAMLVAHSAAADTAQADIVVVSATRFADADPRVASNISVITKEEITQSPAVTVADVLKARANVEVRGLFGGLGTETTVDLRGFGDTASSNTLILLDGQRLNPVDSGNINWSAIPLESVERIEIVRGSGTVLFGDRASGGVVNIITDKSGKPRANVSASVGTYGYRSLNASVAGQAPSAYFNLFADAAETDGYRRNNQSDQKAISGRIGTQFGNSETFVDYALYNDSMGLPGALFRRQYETDPRQARTPLDSQKRDGYRLRPGIDLRLSDTLAIQAEAGVDHGKLTSNLVSSRLVLHRDSDMYFATPRLRWRHGLGSMPSETVVGADWYEGKVASRSVFGPPFPSSNVQRAEQKSESLYLQNMSDLTPTATLTLGLRRQKVEQIAIDEAASLRGEATRSRSAYDIGLSVEAAPGMRVFGKIGRTFRFPNTDELFGFDPVTFASVFRGDLRPQHGSVKEIGASWRSGTSHLKTTLYRLDLMDEIGFDSLTFTNTNFPKTRRTGLEFEGDWKLSSTLSTRFAYTYATAEFREGPNQGKSVPLVAAHKASIGLVWSAGAYGTHSAQINYLGNRRYSGDVGNTLEKLPGYATLDILSSWDLKPWTLSLRLLNALDRKYAPFAGFSTFSNDYFYFPADGRTLQLTARYEFL